MPRPPKLAYPRVIPIVMEQDMIEILKNLSDKTGKSISEIVRIAVEEYLIREGYLKLKKNPVAGGESPIQVLEERLNLLELHQLVSDAKAVYSRIINRTKKDLYYFDDISTLNNILQKAWRKIKTLRHPPEKLIKDLSEITGYVIEKIK